MESRARLSALAQRFFVERPKALERSSGFVQRRTAYIDGPALVQMCVLCWMQQSSARYSQLNHVLASLDIQVRNQAIEERFGPASSRLMRQLLEEAEGQLVEGPALEQALWEMRCGGLHGLWVQDARSSERSGRALETPYPQDSLRIVDTA